MKEKIKDTYLASLGIAALTFEKAEIISKELVKKGEIAKEKQQKFIDGLIKKAKDNTQEIDTMIKQKLEYLKQKGLPLKEKQDKIFNDLSVKTKKASTVTEEKLKESFEKAVKELVMQSIKIKEKQIKISESIKEKSKYARGSADLNVKIDEALAKLNIPTQKELEKIKEKIDELSKKIDQMPEE
jgi:polyhydroxyalkanoate synthesis regulator phasin